MAPSRIFIAEDENIVAKDIQSCLERLGYAVVGIVGDGERAVMKAVETQPDLVLMDIVLQGKMDGVEAAEQIRSLLEVPIVYLTAYADDETVRRARITQPFGYVLKPYEERELHIAIQIALYLHEMARKLKESEQWLATTLKSIGDAVIATDIEGSIRFINPVAEALTGWKREEALGRDIVEVCPIIKEQPRAAVDDPATKSLRELLDGSFGHGSLLIARDGRVIPVEESATAIDDPNKKVAGFVFAFHDVSERRQAEDQIEALLLEKEKLLDMIQARVSAICESAKRNSVRSLTNEHLLRDEG